MRDKEFVARSIEQILRPVSSPGVLLEAENPRLWVQRVSLASPRQSREARKMQMHPGHKGAVGAHPIKNALSRSGRHRQISIESHPGFGMRGLHFRNMDRVAPDHQLMIA